MAGSSGYTIEDAPSGYSIEDQEERKKPVEPPPNVNQKPQSSPSAMIGEGEEAQGQGQGQMAQRYVQAGPEEVAGGVKDIYHGDVPGGLHRAYQGAMTTLAPAAIAAGPIGLAEYPAATMTGIAAGQIAKPALKYGTRALGASEPWSNVAGDIGEATGTYFGGRAGKAIGNLASRISFEPRTTVPTPVGTFRYEAPGAGTGAPLPSAGEFYEQRGADLAKRPDELTQAVKEGRAARLPMRMPKTTVLAPSPFAGMTSTRPGEVAALPPALVGEGAGTSTGRPATILPPKGYPSVESPANQPGTPGTAIPGRPTGGEQRLSELLSKRIITPEDQREVVRSLGEDALPGQNESIAAWKARVKGLIRAGRNAKGVEDTETFPAPKGRR